VATTIFSNIALTSQAVLSPLNSVTKANSSATGATTFRRAAARAGSQTPVNRDGILRQGSPLRICYMDRMDCLRLVAWGNI
jgi:hypothetical protein